MGNVLDNRLDAFNTVFNLLPSSSSDNIKQTLQYKINDEWNNSSDRYTIQEEQAFGKLDWNDLEVRLVHVLTDKQTGQKLGDDYKEIIFQDMNHAYGIGKRYSFDNNIWITTNSDLYHYVTASCIIRRCNNVLRWIDEFGNKVQEPCIIEYQIKLSTNDFNSNIITPKGWIEVICQYNDKTKTILPNDRFLFGSPRVAYKVRGDGLNNFLNQNTYDDSSAPLIKLQMDVNQINYATDDIANGYADAYQNNYTISIDQGTSLSQAVGYTSTLTASLKNNGVIVTEPLVWSSSDTSICTIQSNGNFILNAIGSCTVTCSMQNNSLVSAAIMINVVSVSTGIVAIVINPFITSLLQGDSQIYTCIKTVDGIDTSETLTIQDITTGIPSGYYTFSSGTNTFTITNIQMYNGTNVKINVSDGIDNSKEIDIQLMGGW